jgi:DNA-binding transcriptional ArsR family regulator
MLSAPFAMSGPAISKHMRILRESGLFAETQVGRERLYRLKPENLKPVDSWILTYRRFWQVQLDVLKRYMETPE